MCKKHGFHGCIIPIKCKPLAVELCLSWRNAMSHPLASHASDEECLDRIAQAQAEAQRLRHQAMRDFGNGMLDGMGDVWRCGNALWERGLSDSRRTLARSTARLHARWVAHQKWRALTP
jgi:hypothetical protein